MVSIKETMETSLNLIRNVNSGDPFSRYKSWEYCHDIFYSFHKKIVDEGYVMKPEDYDLLALHLSFYLASWGMYRGSTFLLQRDYKTHINVVKVVLNDNYADLWDFNPCDKGKEELEQIIELANTAYQKIFDAYGTIDEKKYLEPENEKDEPITVTLITKILLGTFAISPAFDTFFISGIRCYKKNNKEVKLGCASFYEKADDFKDCLDYLFHFCKENGQKINIPKLNPFNYPMIKKLDMYFWQLGFQCSFISLLDDKIKNFNVDDYKTEKSKRPLKRLRNNLIRNFPSELKFDKDFCSLDSLQNAKETIENYIKKAQ